MSPYVAHQAPSIEEHAEAVSEARMRCPRIDILRKPKLPDAAKSLKRWRLDDLPEHLFEPICFEFDQVVQRISYPLGASFGSQCH